MYTSIAKLDLNSSSLAYRKVTSMNKSLLEARFKFYRLLMKGKFDVYLL